MPICASSACKCRNAARTPESSIASSTLAPSGNSSSRRKIRSGAAAKITLTRMRSGMRAIGFGDEVVDHAVGQFLEAETQRQSGEGIGNLEIEVEGHLAAIIAQRHEIPLSRQGSEGAFDEPHGDAARPVDGVARDEVLGKTGETQVQPRYQLIAL